MRILYDAAMPFAKPLFEQLGQVDSFQAGSLQPADLRDIDVLLVRSTTNVNADLLVQANALKFVATATAGDDHIDKPLLASRGIEYSNAGGCNAQAVAEYVLSAILLFHQKKQRSWQQKSVAIVGAGHVGRALGSLLERMNMSVVYCDPWLQNEDETRSYVSLDAALQQDIISLHTPLVEGGKYPTRNLLNASNMASMQPEQLLIHACRGGVVNSHALLAMLSKQQFSAIIDVWDNEPFIDKALVQVADFATPHIAGHSLEGKAKGSFILFEWLCKKLAHSTDFDYGSLLPHLEQPLSLPLGINVQDAIRYLVSQVYDISKDDRVLRDHMATFDNFAKIRKNYWTRREFSAVSVKLQKDQESLELKNAIHALGFDLVH